MGGGPGPPILLGGGGAGGCWGGSKHIKKLNNLIYVTIIFSHCY